MITAARPASTTPLTKSAGPGKKEPSGLACQKAAGRYFGEKGMESLVGLLANISRGRIFLINLYEGVNASPEHLSATEFRISVWTPVRTRLTPNEKPSRALQILFSFLHEPANRPLRFRRSPLPRRSGRIELWTTTCANDVLYNPNKSVLRFLMTQSAPWQTL